MDDQWWVVITHEWLLCWAIMLELCSRCNLSSANTSSFWDVRASSCSSRVPVLLKPKIIRLADSCSSLVYPFLFVFIPLFVRLVGLVGICDSASVTQFRLPAPMLFVLFLRCLACFVGSSSDFTAFKDEVKQALFTEKVLLYGHFSFILSQRAFSWCLYRLISDVAIRLFNKY